MKTKMRTCHRCRQQEENSKIENQRQYKNKTYLFFADAKKCFDKLWLKDCLGYSPGMIRSLYEI